MNVVAAIKDIKYNTLFLLFLFFTW